MPDAATKLAQAGAASAKPSAAAATKSSRAERGTSGCSAFGSNHGSPTRRSKKRQPIPRIRATTKAKKKNP